ncbi:MAG: DUF1349 domain-containing protein [Cyclobacteriaceae bacterium]|nr:DUF1349 domain-containing protein [Cyclobacteriaceae bacterium HetDA_MAG_MS6]
MASWINEPSDWKYEKNRLEMFVTGKTDFWRKTHYGFTVDDGPFFYTRRGGEFEVSAKISADYQARYDQAGLMIRVDETMWIKAGIEYVDGRFHASTVVTRNFSDWSLVALGKNMDAIFIKMLRKLDAVEVSYSIDGSNYQLMRLAYFPDNIPVDIGLMAASPDGEGFNARFDHIQIKHLPDQRRINWLSENA